MVSCCTAVHGDDYVCTARGATTHFGCRLQCCGCDVCSAAMAMSRHDTRLAMPHAFAGSRNLWHILIPAETNYRLTKVLLHPLHGICVGVGPAEGINYSHLLPGLFVVGGPWSVAGSVSCSAWHSFTLACLWGFFTMCCVSLARLCTCSKASVPLTVALLESFSLFSVCTLVVFEVASTITHSRECRIDSRLVYVSLHVSPLPHV